MFTESQRKQAHFLFQKEMRKHPKHRVSEETLKILEIVAYHSPINLAIDSPKKEPNRFQSTRILTEKESSILQEMSSVAKKHNIKQNVNKILDSGLSKKQIRKLLGV